MKGANDTRDIGKVVPLSLYLASRSAVRGRMDSLSATPVVRPMTYHIAFEEMHSGTIAAREDPVSTD